MSDDLMPEMEEVKELFQAYERALTICPPDQYQMRQNALTISIAEFLLKPYLKEILPG